MSNETAVALIWEDPPKLTSKEAATQRNAAVLAQLKAHPGRWAKVAVGVHSGHASTWSRFGCEVRRVGSGDRTTIYARWPKVEDLITSLDQ